MTVAAPSGGAPMRADTASCTAGSSWNRLTSGSTTAVHAYKGDSKTQITHASDVSKRRAAQFIRDAHAVAC